MEEIIVYEYWTARNKGTVSMSKLKKEFIKFKGLRCYLCNDNFTNDRQLELEHKIPVILGGRIFDKNNMDLVCIKCHQKKSVIDRHIVFALRSMRLIWGNYIISSILTLNEIEEFYKKYYDKINQGKLAKENFEFKTKRKYLEENRIDENGKLRD